MKTNVKETSLDAYHHESMPAIRNKYHTKILDYMKAFGGGRTRKEIGYALSLDANQYSARCNELVDAKDLVVVGKRKCSITNRTVEELMHKDFANPEQKELFQ